MDQVTSTPGAMSYSARLLAYGVWIAGLADWGEFVTLTHRPRRHGSRTQVGVAFHRRMVKDWFYGDHAFRGRGVVDIDPSARMWAETELHVSGVPHEHALIATSVDYTERRAMRDAWRYVCGDLAKGQGAYFEHVRDVAGAAAYVAKYTVKSATKMPRVLGFGTSGVVLNGQTVSELALSRALSVDGFGDTR